MEEGEFEMEEGEEEMELPEGMEEAIILPSDDGQDENDA